MIRTLWDTSVKGGVRIEGEHHQVVGAKRGPAPALEPVGTPSHPALPAPAAPMRRVL